MGSGNNGYYHLPILYYWQIYHEETNHYQSGGNLLPNKYQYLTLPDY